MVEKTKILIIDDEDDLTMLLSCRLEAIGFLVETASDGKTGLAKAHLFKPDFILLDIVMPEMDGWEVCRQLKADPKTKECHVVIMTAVGSTITQGKVRKSGADDFLTKPFEDKELIAILEKSLK